MITVPPHFTTDHVTVNGVSICFYRSGGGKPPLVMAHGMTDMGLCWTRIADGLRHKYDVIMYDARGHGQSETSVDGHDPNLVVVIAKCLAFEPAKQRGGDRR